MRIYTTVPVANPGEAGPLFRNLENIGYDGAFSFETKHDPFLPLAVAAGHTEKIALGTAIAIAFARNPMNLANIGYDLQIASRGRFILGLGSQIWPRIFTAGVQPRMTEVAGEVADGFIAHPFGTRKSLRDNTLAALQRGLD